MMGIEWRVRASTFIQSSLQAMKIAAVGGLLLGVAADRVEAATGAPRSCGSMVGLTVPGSGMMIAKAEAVPAATGVPGVSPDTKRFAGPLPAYCRLQGTIGARTGADGKPYGLTVAIALPEDWNGRLLVQGGED